MEGVGIKAVKGTKSKDRIRMNDSSIHSTYDCVYITLRYLPWTRGVFSKQHPRTRYTRTYYLNIRGCIQKFPDWVDNERNNKHSFRSNTKGYGGKLARLTHKIAIQLYLVAEPYHFQFPLQVASPETFRYTFIQVSKSLAITWIIDGLSLIPCSRGEEGHLTH